MKICVGNEHTVGWTRGVFVDHSTNKSCQISHALVCRCFLKVKPSSSHTKFCSIAQTTMMRVIRRRHRFSSVKFQSPPMSSALFAVRHWSSRGVRCRHSINIRCPVGGINSLTPLLGTSLRLVYMERLSHCCWRVVEHSQQKHIESQRNAAEASVFDGIWQWH